jgi:hypothetical protein
MVQLLRREPVTEYELRDGYGRAIGHVIQPAGAPRTGPGAETVLLIRGPRSGSTRRCGLPTGGG